MDIPDVLSMFIGDSSVTVYDDPILPAGWEAATFDLMDGVTHLPFCDSKLLTHIWGRIP
ncbi:MAG: hypothetical protein ACRD2G_17640 [Terriglobia bacterium]